MFARYYPCFTRFEAKCFLTNALKFFNGAAKRCTIDNTSVLVASGSGPDATNAPEMAAFGQFFGTRFVPHAIGHADRKAKVEAGVQLVERWILARLRPHTFFSLVELNDAIAELLVDLNERPFQKLPGSRKSSFESLDRPALKPLPTSPYDYAEWKQAKPGLDYHVQVDRHYYSVPHRLVGQRLDVRISSALVEVFHKSRRVASHPRHTRGGFTTVPVHMPKSHQKHRQWNPGRFLIWAKEIGPCTLEVVKRQLTDRPHPKHPTKIL